MSDERCGYRGVADTNLDNVFVGIGFGFDLNLDGHLFAGTARGQDGKHSWCMDLVYGA